MATSQARFDTILSSRLVDVHSNVLKRNEVLMRTDVDSETELAFEIKFDLSLEQHWQQR